MCKRTVRTKGIGIVSVGPARAANASGERVQLILRRETIDHLDQVVAAIRNDTGSHGTRSEIVRILACGCGRSGLKFGSNYRTEADRVSVMVRAFGTIVRSIKDQAAARTR